MTTANFSPSSRWTQIGRGEKSGEKGGNEWKQKGKIKYILKCF
jgi:hypothetical protein